ncbi:MAG: hypothetical protein CMB31_04990 [Euryarchaeota archaeon]|nr:hypothetical protein [Euryarchaeota archaeon]
MSAETLKYFDKLSNENIINWMIQNLTEDQIRTCLNKEGSKDTSKIPGGSGTPGGSGIRDQNEAALDVQRIYRGRLARRRMSAPTQSSDSRSILEELYTKCNGMGYVIASVENDIVSYYHFKEFDSDVDIQAGINREVEDGVATWTYNTVPLDVFMDSRCEADEREVFQALRDDPDNNDNFSPVPDDIYKAAQDYKKLGFDPPVDIYNISGDSPEEDIEPDPQYVMSDTMMKAINTQKKSVEFMRKEFNDDSDYMKMWPIFFVDIDSDNKLSYLFPQVSSSGITFSTGKMNPRLLNTECKKLTKKIVSDIRNQNITDVMDKLNSALREQDDDTICRIKFNYDERNHFTSFGDSYFGEDSESLASDDQSNFGEDIGNENESNFGEDIGNENESNFGEDIGNENESNFGVKKRKGKTTKDPFDMSAMYEGLDDDMDYSDESPPIPMITGIKPTITKQKKVSDMTIPEIEERMLRMHGAKYVSEFKPEKYKTKSGGTSVRYVKRNKCVSTSECTCTPRVMDRSLSRYGDCPACIMAKYGDIPDDTTPVFPEFNTEFGESEELLF